MTATRSPYLAAADPDGRLTPEQADAASRILDALLDGDIEGARILLTGFAGTGKTFLLAAILRGLNADLGIWHKPVSRFDSDGHFEGTDLIPRSHVRVCAPTHKACRQTEQAMSRLDVPPVEALTLHSLLGLRLVRDRDTGREHYAPDPKGNCQIEPQERIFIIDECSMISEYLLSLLYERLHDHQSVLFIGDPRQLPPVDDGVLASLFDEHDLHCHLSTVQRHAGPILDLATATRNLDGGRPVFHAAADHQSSITTYPFLIAWEHAAINAVAESLVNGTGDTIILAYTNKDVAALCVKARAKAYGATAPSFVEGERIITRGAIIAPFTGFPLVHSTTELIVRNATWYEDEIVGDDEPCIVKAVADESGAVPDWPIWDLDCEVVGGSMVSFSALDYSAVDTFKASQSAIAAAANALKNAKTPDEEEERRHLWGIYFSRRDQFASVQSAAALTIHKSQGSTYEKVFLHPDIDYAKKDPDLHNRLAYVGISRASTELHVVSIGASSPVSWFDFMQQLQNNGHAG